MKAWKLSVGTAGAIGLRKLKTDALPTTAYVMLGEKCLRNCAFCAQARESTAAAKYLSRVAWQETAEAIAVEAIKKAYSQGLICRACLQIVNRPDSLDVVRAAVRELVASHVPVVVSGYITSVAEAGQLFGLGVSRIGLAMDVATPELFARIKGGSWQERWALLCACAEAYPGCMTTHLIVGLGETEAEMLAIIKECTRRQITVGLFAFTPVKGTVMGNCAPPPLAVYRRLQMARALLLGGAMPEQLVCGANGKISFRGIAYQELLADGTAFRTSGCEGCNRPFYNERPGHVLYNYPRALTEQEIQQAFVESEAE